MLTIAQALDEFFHARTVAYLDEYEKHPSLIEVWITEIQSRHYSDPEIDEVELTLIPKRRAEREIRITSYMQRFSSLYAMQEIQTDI